MKMIKSFCQNFNISWIFIKFLFVGVLNTLLGYGVFALSLFDKFQLHNMYINYAILLPLNAILSYVLMKKFVFYCNRSFVNKEKSS